MEKAFDALKECVPLMQRMRCRNVGDLITVMSKDVPEDVCEAVERALKGGRDAGGEVDGMELATLGGSLDRIAVWRGDITRLKVDAVVNAANGQMLGCFTLGHKCIDNVIHAAAGPRLRMACRRIMEAQGHEEPPGRAHITPAYCLPSKFVLHTVGPIFNAKKDQSAILASCYTSCLDLALEKGLRSVAFCCISTGVFGYPNEDAARVAVRAVVGWLEAHPQDPMRVIFDTFTEQDTKIYKEMPLFSTEAGQLLALSRFVSSNLIRDLLIFFWRNFNEEAISSLIPRGVAHDDMYGIRLCGAVHYGALKKMHPGLASWPSRDCFASIIPFLRENKAWAISYVAGPPQTNEPKRCAVLWSGMQSVLCNMFPQAQGRARLLELGSSAGLNLLLDRYSYQCDAFSFSPPAQAAEAPVMRFEWRGDPIAEKLVQIQVLERKGCDQKPVNDMTLLRSYFWADQVERMQLLEKAINFRELETGLVVEQADAAEWIERELTTFPRKQEEEEEEAAAVTFVYHSVFYQYPPQHVRESIARSIANAGARATQAQPLVWLRFENSAALGGSDSSLFLLDAIVYPGGERKILAEAHYHGHWIHWKGVN